MKSPQTATSTATSGTKKLREFLLNFERAKTPAQDERAARRREEQFLRLLEEAEAKAEATGKDEYDVELPAEWDEEDLPKTVRIGGRPEWLQRPEKPRCPICKGPMRFLAQIEAEVRSFDSAGFPHGYYLPFDGGIAYTFICCEECSDKSAAALWQMT